MKFETLRGARRFWISGIIAAIVGILLARFVAPQFEPKTAIIAKVAGQLIAMAGLLIICIGIKRRTSGDNPPES